MTGDNFAHLGVDRLDVERILSHADRLSHAAHFERCVHGQRRIGIKNYVFALVNAESSGLDINLIPPNRQSWQHVVALAVGPRLLDGTGRSFVNFNRSTRHYFAGWVLDCSRDAAASAAPGEHSGKQERREQPPRPMNIYAVMAMLPMEGM